MPTNNHWRNKQIGNNLLWQESQCLQFLKKYPDLTWSWHSGIKGHFYDLCSQELNLGSQGNGAIIINYPVRVSVDMFITTLKKILTTNVKIAYLAVNRYEFVADYTTDNNYSDQIKDCIDLIVSNCCGNFRRLHHPEAVDEKHFVGVHGLDVFVYENNNRL